MNGYDIQFDGKNNTITVKYHRWVNYETLLKSLEDLHGIGMLDRIGLVLDFSEVQTFVVGYQQITNFRQGLKSLLPRKKVAGVAIINPQKRTLLDSICSNNQPVENDFLHSPCSCFTVEKSTEAFQLLH